MIYDNMIYDMICECIWENRLVSEKNKIIFLPFMSSEDVPSKFEANLMLCLQERHTPFSPLASSCSNDYFCAYATIDFLANQFKKSILAAYN